jgi:hypothetical protein
MDMEEKAIPDDFTGNPWHPFLRVLRRRTENLPPEHLSRLIKTPGGGTPLRWNDLFRLDLVVRRLVPTRELNEAEIRTLADWLGLEGEEHEAFLELGAAFLAQRDWLRQLRQDPGLAEDEETDLVEEDVPRPDRPAPPPVAESQEPAAPAESPVADESIPGMETATTASECLRLLCRYRQTDLEWLARAVAQRLSSLDTRAILLQLRGTLPVMADRVLEAALTILKAPPTVAAQARAFNG